MYNIIFEMSIMIFIPVHPFSQEEGKLSIVKQEDSGGYIFSPLLTFSDDIKSFQ